MTNSFSADEAAFLQHSLQQMAIQLGKSLDVDTAAQLYQDACDLLSRIPYAPITLARVAGTLLIYHFQETEAAELAWFKSQVQQCSDSEEVEELIESLSRPDAL